MKDQIMLAGLPKPISTIINEWNLDQKHEKTIGDWGSLSHQPDFNSFFYTLLSAW